MTNILDNDSRYTVTLESVGTMRAKYIARFCGNFISLHLTYGEAVTACTKHKKNSLANVEQLKKDLCYTGKCNNINNGKFKLPQRKHTEINF